MSARKPRHELKSIIPKDPPRDIAGYDPTRDAMSCTYQPDRAAQVIEFFERELELVYGKTGQFALAPWQRDVLATLFGWIRRDGTRRYREAFIAIPRKNGKTCFTAGIGLYLFLRDNEPGAQIYLAACDRDQATLLYSAMQSMIEKNDALRRGLKILDSTKRIIRPGDSSLIKAIAADAAGAHGYNAHGVLIDELHTQKSRDLYDVLKTSTAARRQPLLVSLTTAGQNKQSICYEMWQYAERVRRGEERDPYFLPVIYEADEDDDWTDERVWEKANPSLGYTLSIDYLREAYNRARQNAELEATFRRLHLNQWVESSLTWISDAQWQACYDPAACEESRLQGALCYVGIDLGMTDDLTSMVYLFPMGDYCVVKCYAWCAQSTLAQAHRPSHSKYQSFARQGWLTVTDGKTTDFRRLLAQLAEDSKKYNIVGVGVDPWNGRQLQTQIEELGLEVVTIQQTCAHLTVGTNNTYSMCAERRLRHDGNDLLRWCISNVELIRDSSGNAKPDKKNTVTKIDPVVALVMAVQLYISQANAGIMPPPKGQADKWGVIWI
jgi:phage terminase large subunit-like protein